MRSPSEVRRRGVDLQQAMCITGCVLLFSTALHAARICTWPKNAVSAVTYTFDDGLQSQLDYVVPALNEAKLPATFFLVSSRVEDWEPWRRVAEDAHEIGSHSLNHKGFRGYIREYNEAKDKSGLIDPMVSIEEELRVSKEHIESEIPGYPCVSYAYAYCQTDGAHNFIHELYIGARACGRATSGSEEEDVVSVRPEDLYKIAGVLNDREGSNLCSDKLNAFVEHAVAHPQWVVFAFHGVEDDSSWKWADIDTLNAHWEFVHTKTDEIWVGTFGNAARYIAERECATVSEDIGDDTIYVTCRDTLRDDNVYNYPLTIGRELPAGWTSLRVRNEAGDSVWYTVEGDSVYFAVVPDAQRVLLINDGSVGVQPSGCAPSPGGANRLPNDAFSLHGRRLSAGHTTAWQCGTGGVVVRDGRQQEMNLWR